MTTGADVANEALGLQGIPYSAGSDRFLNTSPQRGDCSGICHAILLLLKVDDRGADGWTSLTFQDWITASGRTGSLPAARVTPGMVVCLGHTGGPHGHIAITLGNNTVFETPSAAGPKSGISPFDRNGYDFAGYIPGVDYPAGMTLASITANPQATADGCLQGCASGGCLLTVGALAGAGVGLELLTKLAHLL